MANKKPARQASRASSLGYPGPPTGTSKPGGDQSYPEPNTSNLTLGLNLTSHNGSNYPQPNSANNPDTSSSAGPAPFPGPEAYRPNIAGNSMGDSVGEPGVIHGNEPPNLSSNDVD